MSEPAGVTAPARTRRVIALPKYARLAIVAIGLLIILVMLIPQFGCVIRENQMGILVQNSQVQDKTYKAGIHLKWPWQRIMVIDLTPTEMDVRFKLDIPNEVIPRGPDHHDPIEVRVTAARMFDNKDPHVILTMAKAFNRSPDDEAKAVLREIGESFVRSGKIYWSEYEMTFALHQAVRDEMRTRLAQHGITSHIEYTQSHKKGHRGLQTVVWPIVIEGPEIQVNHEWPPEQ